jgi:hypothetical protein
LYIKSISRSRAYRSVSDAGPQTFLIKPLEHQDREPILGVPVAAVGADPQAFLITPLGTVG